MNSENFFDRDSMKAACNSAIDQGAYIEAITILHQAIAANPQDDWAHFHLGLAHFYLRDYTTAKLDFENAIRYNATKAVSYFNRGVCENWMGNFDAAFVDAEIAIAMDPEYAAPYGLRGEIHLIREDFAAAFRDFDTANSLDPEDQGNIVNRGIARFGLQQYEAAMEDASTALDMLPGDSCANLLIAEIHSVWGNDELFYGHLEAALESDPREIENLFERTLIRHQNEEKFQALLQKYAPQK